MPGPQPAPDQTHWLLRPGGVRLRCVAWPAPRRTPRATALVLTGRAEYVEKYAEVAHDLTARGFAVRSFDWRGQGLSSRLLPDPTRGHLDSVESLTGDLEAVIREWVPADRPCLILAHSMGGHVVLRWLADRTEMPERLRGVAVTAPLLDVEMPGVPPGLLRRGAALTVRAGLGDQHPPGHRQVLRRARTFEGNKVTSDADRFALHKACEAANPALRLGGITWGWLDAFLTSIQHLQEPGRLERITVPVLLGLAGRDAIVDKQAIEEAARRIPDAWLVRYPDALHEILMERDSIRSAFWQDFDAFTAPLLPV